MLKKQFRQYHKFYRFVILLDFLFAIFLYFGFINLLNIYFIGTVVIFINAVYFFVRSDKDKLAEPLVNLLLLCTITAFIIYIFSESKNPPSIFGIVTVLLLFISLVMLCDFIFRLTYRIYKTRKFQLVFNILVTGFMIGVSVLLYRSNIFNQQLAEMSAGRLQLLERKFGGEKNLKCQESETIKKVRESVVRIIGGEAEGSGFSVNSEGYILTNFHVIEFEPAPRVMFPDNSVELTEIIYGDKNADLAVLKVSKKIPAIDWGNSDEVEPAEEILSFGFPFGGSLGGEATVKKGYLSAKRNIQDQGLEFIQTDSTINPGMSGGPMTTVCGKFIGINTLGTAGMGMAISSNSFKNKYLEMKASSEPLKDIVKVEFKPDESPVETVKAFYNYIKIRKLDKAFELLQGGSFVEGMTFENWKKGYAPNLDTSLLKIEKDPDKENIVNIKLSTKDMIDGQIIYKFFEGWWEVKEVDGHLKLWQPKIREVENPSWLWFYE